jgi:hypothetical protein
MMKLFLILVATLVSFCCFVTTIPTARAVDLESVSSEKCPPFCFQNPCPNCGGKDLSLISGTLVKQTFNFTIHCNECNKDFMCVIQNQESLKNEKTK